MKRKENPGAPDVNPKKYKPQNVDSDKKAISPVFEPKELKNKNKDPDATQDVNLEDKVSNKTIKENDKEVLVKENKNTDPDATQTENVSLEDKVSNKTTKENVNYDLIKENNSINNSSVSKIEVQHNKFSKKSSESLYPISKLLKEAHTALGYHDEEFL